MLLAPHFLLEMFLFLGWFHLLGLRVANEGYRIGMEGGWRAAGLVRKGQDLMPSLPTVQLCLRGAQAERVLL